MIDQNVKTGISESMQLYEKIQASADYLKKLIHQKVEHALVLGTGLGSFSDTLHSKIVIPYSDIPYFPVSTVQSHNGQLVFGIKNDLPLIILSGRFHYYEGYSAAEVSFPIRVLKALGINHLILTNAAGAVNPHFESGDIILITDHINLMPDHPLRGPNDERIGLRFPDMMDAYDPKAISIVRQISKNNQLKIKEGVYLGLQGPSLETPAEYKMARILGADMIGMSTVPEVIVANHCDIKVLAFSIISNVCYPRSKQKVTTIQDVLDVVRISSHTLEKILEHYINTINQQRR